MRKGTTHVNVTTVGLTLSVRHQQGSIPNAPRHHAELVQTKRSRAAHHQALTSPATRCISGAAAPKTMTSKQVAAICQRPGAYMRPSTWVPSCKPGIPWGAGEVLKSPPA